MKSCLLQLEIVIFCEISQSQKEKLHVLSDFWHLIENTNISIRPKHILLYDFLPLFTLLWNCTFPTIWLVNTMVSVELNVWILHLQKNWWRERRREGDWIKAEGGECDYLFGTILWHAWIYSLYINNLKLFKMWHVGTMHYHAIMKNY